MLAIAAGFVARRIFGPGFARTVPALHILSAALPLVFLNCGLTHFLVARDLGVLNMVFAGLMVPVNVVANVVLSRRLGAPGAAWSMLITEAALSLCCLLALYVRGGGRTAERAFDTRFGSAVSARRGPR